MTIRERLTAEQALARILESLERRDKQRRSEAATAYASFCAVLTPAAYTTTSFTPLATHERDTWRSAVGASEEARMALRQVRTIVARGKR